MIEKGFLRNLVLTAVSTMGLLLILAQFVEACQDHLVFGAACILFFVIFTLIAYVKGMQAVRSQNKNTFTAQFMALIFIKMLLSILIVVAYSKMLPAGTGDFLWMFLLPYIVFSILEYYYLTRIAKLN